MTWRTTWILVAAAAITLGGAILLTAGPFRPPIASAGPTVGATSVATPAATATVACAEEPGDLTLGLRRPACPTAILAVELAVAPVRLPIERIVIQPGPFFCDVLWPGPQTAKPGCRGGGAVQPGQFMHAWVAFRDSPKVAVVMLGLDLPDFTSSPRPTRPPWITTIVTTEIPPTGWVMP